MSRKKVYSMFQINIIVFIVFCIMTVPIVAVVSYIFNLQDLVSVTTIFYVALSVLIINAGVGVAYIVITKENYRRRLKPSYQKEFTFVMTITAIGVLGCGVLFMYLGGIELYVPHLIIPIGIFAFTVLYLLGDRFFNINLLRR